MDELNETNQDNEEVVTGEDIEPDESRTPTEFAREEYLSIDQVAHQMGVSATRVREWVASGLLTTVPEGSIERIRRSDLNRIGNPDDKAAKKFEKEHEE